MYVALINTNANFVIYQIKIPSFPGFFHYLVGNLSILVKIITRTSRPFFSIRQNHTRITLSHCSLTMIASLSLNAVYFVDDRIVAGLIKIELIYSSFAIRG